MEYVTLIDYDTDIKFFPFKITLMSFFLSISYV